MQIDEVLLVGNPNAGKSTFFNQLTGLKQKVGNFPGITVEKSFAQFKGEKLNCKIVDLPGVYSLVPQQQSTQDERVTLNYLAQAKNAVVVNIVDATALERHLYLTVQLLEFGLPMVVVLNKWDLAQQAKIDIDVAALSKQLKCPVLTCNANQNQTPEFIEPSIVNVANQNMASLQLSYDQVIEQALTKPQANNNRFLSLLSLIEQNQIRNEQGFDAELMIASTRYQYCHQIAQAVVTQQADSQALRSDKIDAWLLKPWLALPTFFFAMYLMFMFAINIGGAFIDFFDIAVGALLVDGLAQVLNAWHWPEWLVVLLTEGVGTGVQTVSTFIPLIFCLYFFLTFLEQSGYLARAAVVTDRVMQKAGLPGSAFVPLMMGFGCTVPAVMATRTLKQKRERILSSAMSHFMVCGARLPVFALFAAAFFPNNALTIVFSLYLLGIVAAIVTGIIFRKTVLAGQASPFIIELPQYQMPNLVDLLQRSVQRLKGFVFGAGKTIVIVVTILGMLNSVGKDGSFGNAGKANSVLSVISQTVTPVFKPMGIEQDNWQATVGIFTGLFAKEVLVGSLNSLYQTDNDEQAFVLSEQLTAAVDSITEHFAELSDKLLDPLGIGATDVENVEQAASAQEVSMTTLSQIVKHFNGQVGAFAYLLFILMYAPCASALGAIAREFNGRWALLMAMWSTLLAYVSATVFYQLATAAQLFSLNLVVTMIALLSFIFSVYLLKNQKLHQWLEQGAGYVKPYSSSACH